MPPRFDSTVPKYMGPHKKGLLNLSKIQLNYSNLVVLSSCFRVVQVVIIEKFLSSIQRQTAETVEGTGS